ncbi:MAG TPA: ammonium transporter [Oligoflexia bacterium]|nr:ammonium transporter [Oligoflexia bacterium]HMP48219.1 ammonium transporter [Oligoflexia bacterium]
MKNNNDDLGAQGSSGYGKKSWAVLAGIFGLFALIAAFIPESSKETSVQELSIDSGDTAWMLAATALVLLMTPGLSFFYGGMVQRKNIISTMLQSYICMGIVSMLWVAFVFSLCFGESFGGFIGNPLTFFMFRGVGGSPHPDFGSTIPFVLFALFQLKFAIITPALISGSFAERVRFSSYMLFTALFSVFIYAPIAHWTWHPEGFLRVWGVLDFAGGTVVHMSAGIAALAGAMVLGRRKSHIEGRSTVPANIPFVLLGTGMLWFGWFGFNAGSALGANSDAALAFLTTNTASAAAMLAWIMFDAMSGRKPSALGACIGAVVGLVAITPAAGFVSVGASIFIGFFAAGVSNYAVHLRSKLTLDDTLDVFPCHGIGGITGMLLTAVFAKEVGVIAGAYQTFLYHLLAVLVVGGFSFSMSLLIYKIVSLVLPLRVSEEHENIGLDLAQHGESMFELEMPFTEQFAFASYLGYNSSNHASVEAGKVKKETVKEAGVH